MTNGLTSVSYFLIFTLFSLITFILWARIFIRYFFISRFHPLYQSIYPLTSPIIEPVHLYIVRGKGDKSRYDWACFLVLALVILLKFSIFNLLMLKGALPFVYIILYTLVDMIVQPCNILFYAIIIRAIMSWFNPNWQNPFPSLLIAVTEPLLKIIRNGLPRMGMLDLSPLVAIIALKVIEILVISCLPFPIL